MLKSFFIGAARIATIIVFTIIALSAVGWGVYEFIQSRERASNAPMGEPKDWPTITLEPLGGIDLNLSTAWRQGGLYYQFRVKGFPKELASVPESDKNAWTLTFLDKNGFKVFGHTEQLSDMTKSVDGAGNIAGLSSNSSTSVSVEDYRLAARWEVTWSFLPIPKQSSWVPPEVGKRPVQRPSGLNWRDVTLWRKLARGMSPDRVREILGEPGKIDEGSALTFWYWGYPAGGEVRFSSGKVEGWSEP
jgi:hypothetical protein